MDINRPEKWCIVSSSVALCKLFWKVETFVDVNSLKNQVWQLWRCSLQKVSYPMWVPSWLCVLNVCLLPKVILAVRTWAVWRRNKIVGAGLAAITLGNLVAQSIFTTDTVRAMILSCTFWSYLCVFFSNIIYSRSFYVRKPSRSRPSRGMFFPKSHRRILAAKLRCIDCGWS